jgi:sodium transport system ATP-binding protein
MPSLIVENVTKRFPSASGPKTVLRGVSFDVPAGSVLCLLGPNGSGKTTLLKTIATLLSPDEGSVRLDALNVHERPLDAKRLMGFSSSEDHSFYGRLSVRENLWFYGRLHGLGRRAWSGRLAELAEQLEMTSLDAPFRELSSGQKQRVLLARALLHNPPVVLLDEPHQNLDPLFGARLRDLLVERWGKREKKTILVSTHHLEDALKLSDRWVVLSGGRAVFSGRVSEARAARPDFSVEKFFDSLLHVANP